MRGVLLAAVLGLVPGGVDHHHVMVRYEYLPSGTVSKELTGQATRVSDYPLRAGDTLTFTNLDPQPHTVTSCDPCEPYPIVTGRFDSGFLTTRESWTLQTSELEPGTYGYFCLHHPFLMRGSLSVA